VATRAQAEARAVVFRAPVDIRVAAKVVIRVVIEGIPPRLTIQIDQDPKVQAAIRAVRAARVGTRDLEGTRGRVAARVVIRAVIEGIPPNLSIQTDQDPKVRVDTRDLEDTKDLEDTRDLEDTKDLEDTRVSVPIRAASQAPADIPAPGLRIQPDQAHTHRADIPVAPDRRVLVVRVDRVATVPAIQCRGDLPAGPGICQAVQGQAAMPPVVALPMDLLPLKAAKPRNENRLREENLDS
jgi:hypothetical protein